MTMRSSKGLKFSSIIFNECVSATTGNNGTKRALIPHGLPGRSRTLVPKRKAIGLVPSRLKMGFRPAPILLNGGSKLVNSLTSPRTMAEKQAN